MGGGFLYVPSLTLIFGFNPKIAVGTSLSISVFAASAASFRYQGQKKILVSTALLMIISSMIFAGMGSVLPAYIDSRFPAFFLLSLSLLFRSRCSGGPLPVVRKITSGPGFVVCIEGENESEHSLRMPYSHLIIWGGLKGHISGTTGISGGVFFVPALIALDVPVHFAVATSLLAIIPTSIIGAATHAAFGHISLPFLIVFGIGAVLEHMGQHLLDQESVHIKFGNFSVSSL